MAARSFRGMFIQTAKVQVTADFPSATTSTTVTVTVAVPDAQVGDFVLVAPVAAVAAGWSFGGTVLAAGSVALAATNGTGGTVDLASQLFNVATLTLKTA